MVGGARTAKDPTLHRTENDLVLMSLVLRLRNSSLIFEIRLCRQQARIFSLHWDQLQTT